MQDQTSFIFHLDKYTEQVCKRVLPVRAQIYFHKCALTCMKNWRKKNMKLKFMQLKIWTKFSFFLFLKLHLIWLLLTYLKWKRNLNSLQTIINFVKRQIKNEKNQRKCVWQKNCMISLHNRSVFLSSWFSQINWGM